MSSRSLVTIEDLALSGPHVWPKITAERQADIFIFSRPELTYLPALRKLRAETPPEELRGDRRHVKVRVQRARYVDKTVQLTGNAKSWWHFVLKDPEEDVRKLLGDLRAVLVNMMPHDAEIGLCVRVEFFDTTSRKIASLQRPWL